jgi:hypothetical protein
MDKEIEGTDVAVGAVGSDGERRSSTLSIARDEGELCVNLGDDGSREAAYRGG